MQTKLYEQLAHEHFGAMVPDWVWIRKGDSDMVPGGMSDRIPARLNCIFKMRITRGDLVYRLAHATLTTIVG